MNKALQEAEAQRELKEKRNRWRWEAEDWKRVQRDIQEVDFDCEPDPNIGVPLDKSEATK